MLLGIFKTGGNRVTDLYNDTDAVNYFLSWIRQWLCWLEELGLVISASIKLKLKLELSLAMGGPRLLRCITK